MRHSSRFSVLTCVGALALLLAGAVPADAAAAPPRVKQRTKHPVFF